MLLNRESEHFQLEDVFPGNLGEQRVEGGNQAGNPSKSQEGTVLFSYEFPDDHVNSIFNKPGMNDA